MNDERFRSGLNIAGYCLTIVSEDLQALSTHASPPAVTEKLLQIRESLDNCVLIIEALQHYLATPHPVPSLEVAPFSHCL